MDDVLQEVFVRIIEKRHTFRGECSPSTWVYQVTTRHCLNVLRQQRRRRELLTEAGSPWWSPSVGSGGQEASTLVHQLWAQIDEEVALMGIYFHLDGMTRQEIADRFGVSLRTVGNRLEALRVAGEALGAPRGGGGDVGAR